MFWGTNNANVKAIQAFEEDQKRRRKEAEEGKVRYVEAAQASRPQYTLPQYQGKSEKQGSKTYNWEKELLYNTKVKGAGNSYNKKFDALTSSMGMTEAQAQDFRRYLDFQEDSQHVDPKKNKDGKINQNQSLKYARDVRMRTDVIDEILNNMTKRAKKSTEVPFEKVSTWDKLQNAMGFGLTDAQKNTLEAKELGVEPHYGGKKDKTDPITKSYWEDLRATKAREDKENGVSPEKETKGVPNYLPGAAGMQDFNLVLPSSQPKAEEQTDYSKANAVLSGEKSVDDRYAKADAILHEMNPTTADKIKGFFTGENDIYGRNKETNPYYRKLDKDLEGFESSYNAVGKVIGGKQPDEVDRFIAQVANTAVGGANKELALARGNQESVDAFYNEREFGEGGGTDMIAKGLGYIAPAGKLYKGVNAIKPLAVLAERGVAPRILAEALKGGAVGAGLSTGEVGVKEAINPENQDYHQNLDYIGKNTALGMVADPLLYGAGMGLKAGAQNILGRMAKVDGELPTFSGNASDNVLDSLVPNQQGAVNPSSNNLYDNLIKQANPGVKEADDAIVQAQTQKQAAEDEFVRQALFTPQGPGKWPQYPSQEIINNTRQQFQNTPQAQQIDNLIEQLTGQRESALNTTNEAPVVNDWRTKVQEPAPVSMENIQPRTDIPINNWQDKQIVNNSQVPEPVQPSQNAIPESQINDEYVQDALKLREMTDDPAEKDALDSLIESITGKKPERPRDLKAEEDAFVSEQMKPHYESLQKAADAQAQWENVVKRSKDQIQTIKQTFGKIYVPSHSLEDYPVPKQFLAGSKDKHSDDIFSFVDQMGFKSPEEAVQFLQVLDAESKTKLKDMMPENTLETKDLRYLEESLRKQFREQGVPKAQQNDVLNQLDELVHPKTETEAVKPAQAEGEVAAGTGKEPLLRLNIQQFAPSTARSLVETRAPISTESPIAKINNPIKRTINKFYEGYVNRNHSAKVTEVKSLETAINKAKTEGRTKKAEQLTQRLKQVKKSGSDFDKALGNELASAAGAQNLLNRHFENLAGTMGGNMKEMSGALEFQMAKNLDWIKRNVDPDYELPNGWDWGDINRVINSGVNNQKYASFIDQFRNMTQELRDLRLDYGLISKESHEALGKNPFYIPMQRDMSQIFDNIDIGSGRIGTGGRGSGDKSLHSLDGGSVETFFKNPLESVIDQAFQVYKAAYRNDTAQQALKMAKLDKDGSLGLAKEVHPKTVKPGDLTVYVNGQKRYVRLQDDLVKMMNENESVLDLGKIGKVTQLFAALKTRSFEYQTAAAPRDMVQAYVTSQISRPDRYIKEVFKAIKNKSASAKEVGAYFDKAYNDHVAGVDPKKVLKEFQQKAGNVKVFSVKDPQSWKEVGGVVKKILDTPFKPSKWLGQVTDEIPREIEVKEAERLFMKKHGEKINNIQTALDDVNRQIQAAQGGAPFSPQTKGIDQLIHQKDQMENMLRQFQQDLKREKIYRGRDVMDYSRMGNSKATKNIIRPWVIFANTTTQSKDKMIRSFIERPGATIAKATAVVAPFVAAEVINHDNMSDSDRKIYDKLPKWMSQFNYVYVDNGSVYAVPKLQELALITNPIEAALKGDSLNDSMRLLTKETVPYQFGNVAQGLVPDEDGNTLSDRDKMTKNVMGVTAPSTVLGPIADVMFNDKTTFNRKPISFYSDKSNKWTMDLFTKLAGKEPNADALQYIYQQYLGDFGKYSSYGTDAAIDPGNSDKLDELLRNLNPLQDRIFKPDSRYFKKPQQETKK